MDTAFVVSAAPRHCHRFLSLVPFLPLSSFSVVGTVPHRCHPELDSGSILAFGANSTVLGKGRCEILNQVQDDNDGEGDNDGGGVNDREG